MKIAVYYDYFEGVLSPLWYVITFRKGELNWNRDTAYVPIETPFERQSAEDFISEKMGITVTLGDLTLNEEKIGKFGIQLAPLRKRAQENMKDYWDAEYLLLQVSDLEEVLQMKSFC
ncbi:hypothetical protein [Brevibacillus choshinensis]|uniref:Uncharacterized protein n=1 Tax=Brevibacillus choshinensis TaxID=54911 RepID=A0ABX7FJ30_BRECH|nr:hypothetical protein [Brevibacillus choshinensis]QRG65287.1 hypothetical protein JNE38_16745 [Brevibacillus choshinensis]